MHYYKAFGFNVSSEIKLPQMMEQSDFEKDGSTIDIQISVKDLSYDPTEDTVSGGNGKVFKNSKESIFYEVKNVGRFEILQGKYINVQTFDGVYDSDIAFYITGHCFGCILAQREIFALHGSCVCNDGKAIIICGYSGAGKSTLAAEFISHGWKIMSDDITVIKKENGVFCAVSSFPSQKLWQDSADYYDYDSEQLLSMKQEELREKYHIDISDKYFEGTVPLSLIIKLTHKDETCSVTEFFGTDKVNKIIKNIYLQRILNDVAANTNAIHTAVQLADEVRLFYTKRNSNRECSQIIFREITDLLKEE